MIEISKYIDLEEQTKALLEQFIDTEFGHIPIVKEIKWARPDWTILYFIDNQVATFYNIVERNLYFDNTEVKVAGINNVITPKEFRGKGYASKLLNETESFIFEDLSCQFGLLLCADGLIPYYEKLGWYKIDCPVYFEQPSGEKLWTANTMLLSKGEQNFPKMIKLNGLPW